MSLTAILHVASEIVAERERQDVKWGQQDHPDGTGGLESEIVADLLKRLCKAAGPRDGAGDTWLKILAEAVGEAFAETDPAALRAKLVECAAVCAAWVEAIDRRMA
jgi:hypothetical protein